MVRIRTGSASESRSIDKPDDIKAIYSSLDLGTFLRDEKIKATVDEANKTLVLDDRIVMIVAGLHDAFMKNRKTISTRQLGDVYRRQVAAASTYIAVEMECVRTKDESLIRTIEEISDAYRTSKNYIFDTADEIRRSLKMRGHTVDGIVYAKRSIDIVARSLMGINALDEGHAAQYTARAKELLDAMKKNGRDFSMGSKGVAACALAHVAGTDGTCIQTPALARVSGMNSAMSFVYTYNSFKKYIPKE